MISNFMVEQSFKFEIMDKRKLRKEKILMVFGVIAILSTMIVF